MIIMLMGAQPLYNMTPHPLHHAPLTWLVDGVGHAQTQRGEEHPAVLMDVATYLTSWGALKQVTILVLEPSDLS